MKKLVSVLMAVTLMLSVNAQQALATSDLNEVAIPIESDNVNIKFRYVLQAPTEDDIESEDEWLNLVELSRSAGWEYNAFENVFEKYVSYSNLEVSTIIDGMQSKSISTTDEQGYASLIIPDMTETLDIVIHDPNTDLKFTESLDVLNGNDVVINVDWTSMLNGGSSDDAMTRYRDYAYYDWPYWYDGQSGVSGYRLHCNRFNGSGGDNCYYSKKTHPIKALQNFYFSDCDYSINYTLGCIQDDLPFVPNYCEAYEVQQLTHGPKEATCSGDAGRTRYFSFR